MMESSVKTTRIYEKVVEKLKEEIADGRLLPGDPLPSERQLMETFGVSRSSLREAFRVMELLGLIESIAGKGRFVRQPREMTDDRKHGIQLEDSAILELMEARRILDPAIAGESAMRATPSDLMRLLRVITATEERLTLPARERYEAFCRQFPDVCRRAQLGYIASYLGITPQYLSHLKNELADSRNR